MLHTGFNYTAKNVSSGEYCGEECTPLLVKTNLCHYTLNIAFCCINLIILIIIHVTVPGLSCHSTQHNIHDLLRYQT